LRGPFIVSGGYAVTLRKSLSVWTIQYPEIMTSGMMMMLGKMENDVTGATMMSQKLLQWHEVE
jgi:hypothetical protein